MEKLDGKSKDIVEQNIEQLKELFPEVFSEGKIKFNQLQELLGNYVVEDEDHYNFTWHGKRKAGRLAQTPSTGTLRPCKEESVNWDSTQNLFIEGDNLEVLKLLQKSYHRQVKMIYIDPPYNTGNDFVYEDDFKDGVKNYLEMTGQLDSKGKKIGTNSSSAGRYHTNWLNMMYPRLKLARNLLRDDGVIFISIDDNEQANLKKLCDEIFGEENLLGVFIWQKKTQPSFLSREVASITEYIICYKRNTEQRPLKGGLIDMDRTGEVINIGNPIGERVLKKEAVEIENGKFTGTLFSGEYGNGVLVINLQENVDVVDGIPQSDIKIKGRIIQSQITLDKEIEKGAKIFIKSIKTLRPTIKIIRDEVGIKPPTSLLSKKLDTAIPTNTDASKEIKEIFGGINIMDYPKPSNLIKFLIDTITYDAKDSIILDFFAGSGTTAHAVMQLNAEDGGNRKHISVQLPEATDEKSEAYSAGYKNIAEISKERIRRAGKKIQQENPDYRGDLGFKVFKLDSSNIKRWEAGFDTLEQDLFNAVDYLKQDRSSEDVLYELLLKYGLDLTVHIETRTIAGKTVYSIGLGALVVCLDKDINMDVVNGIGALKEELQPEIMRVVFKDDGFKNDVVKTNALQTLKRYGIEDIKSL